MLLDLVQLGDHVLCALGGGVYPVPHVICEGGETYIEEREGGWRERER